MEIWKDIKEYEGLYQVSNLGRVKSLKYGKERILKPTTNKGNYLLVILYKNKKMKTYYIHRLVALTFLPNPQNLPEINHIDEDKTNNCVDNLEFCDRKYNINYGTRIKRFSESVSKKIDQFDLDGNFIRTWSSMCQAERELGISNGKISQCCKGKRISTGKFIWKYHFDV